MSVIGRAYSIVLLYLIGGFVLAGIAMGQCGTGIDAKWILEWLPGFSLPALAVIGAKETTKIGQAFATRHKAAPLSKTP